MPDFPEPLGLVIGDATRLYTVKHGGYKQVLSVGRVQTTLAMVVDRYAAIENFKPQPYWELQTLYRDILLVMKKPFLKRKTENS
jgi:DNA topoisomerase-3